MRIASQDRSASHPGGVTFVGNTANRPWRDFVNRRPALLLLALLALFASSSFLLSCGGDDSEDDSGPRDRDHDGIRDSRDKCDRDKEDEGVWGSDPKDGCPATVGDLIELARSDIDAFWEKEFDGGRTTYDGPVEFKAYTTEIETECGRASLNNAFYCSADHSVYYDEGFLRGELATNGDFAPVLIIAHEWGHLVQSLVGILQDESLYTIQVELQADCLAGYWAADADSRGLLEEGDFEEGVVALYRVRDPKGTPFYDPQAHGTAGERIDAFSNGYDFGLDACEID